MRYTIKDIAKKANVSITTVSLVINKKSQRIKPETVERINEVIKECGYTPNMVARSMITNKTKTIGLIVPDITNPFFSELASGIEDTLNKEGYNMFLCNSYNNLSKEKEYINILMDRKVDGIIISFAKSMTYEEILEVIDLKVPVVFLDRIPYNSQKNCLSVDDFKGGYYATKYLIDNGHRDIVCITGDKEIVSVNKRIDGYIKALKEYGITLKEEYIIESDLTLEGGMKAAKKAFKNKNVTAIFCCNDLMAMGVYEEAENQGVNIPYDVSVVGFDDISFAKHLKPKLTTIRQDIYALGGNGADIIVKLIRENKLEINSVKRDIEFIERFSVCKRT